MRKSGNRIAVSASVLAVMMCVMIMAVVSLGSGFAHADTQWIDVEENSANVRYFAGDAETTWNLYEDATARNGSYMYTTVDGYVVNESNRPAMEFTFTGTQVRFYGARRVDTQSLNFYIDGELAATVDTYNSSANTLNELLFESEQLPWAQHTLRVEAADGNATAFMVVDGISYCDGMQWEEKVMYNSPDIQYSTQPQWHSFDGYYYAQMGDATAENLPFAEYTFVGEYIRFWGLKRPDTTSLRVYIDGEEKAVVSTYSEAQSQPEVLFVSEKLSLSSHTIRIEGIIEPNNAYTLVNAFEVSKSEAVTFPIETSASEGGSVTASTDVTMGENFEVQFTPDEGYSLLRVTVDGVVQPNAKQSYTFTNVSSAHKVEVAFQKEEVLWLDNNRFGSQSDKLVYFPEPSSVSWNQFTQEGAFDGSIMYFPQPSSAEQIPYCEFTFEGVKARFFGMLRADSYRLKVTVDGETSYIVNTNEGSGIDVLFETDLLSQGSHTVRVEGVTDDVASNQYLVIDSFQYAVAMKDKSEIQQYYNETVDKYDQSRYTADSYAVFETKIKALADVLENPDATQLEINMAYSQAVEAENGLVLFTHKISVSVVGNGTVNEIPDVPNGEDSEVLIITPAVGYEVVSFKVDGEEVALEELQYQFKNVTQSHQVEIVFEIITFTVTVEKTGNGTVNVPETVQYGQSLTIEILADPNNYIKSVVINGATYPTDGTIVINGIGSDVTINVVFAEIAYTREQVQEQFQSLKSIKSEKYTQASFADFKFYLDILESMLKEEDSSLIELNTILEMTFDYKEKLVIRNLSVIVSANEGGSATPSFSVLYGQDGEEIVFTPNQGYQIARVTLNGKDVEITDNKLLLTNITSNQDVRVYFEKVKFAVTTQTTGNGLILADSEVIFGDDLSVVIQAQEGYRIVSIVVNGKTMQLDDEFKQEITLNSVDADVSISAEFEKIEVNVITPITIGISVGILLLCGAACVAIVIIAKRRSRS